LLHEGTADKEYTAHILTLQWILICLEECIRGSEQILQQMTPLKG